MNGFINVLKPVGATASDVVVCVKHVLHDKKVGHLGTLDPGASGVLPVAVGQATKLFNFLTNKVKYYRAYFTFGVTTDTLDSYGEVVARSDVLPTNGQVAGLLTQFVGKINQLPPIYSAISVGGVRAYDLARKGVEVELKTRPVEVYSFELIDQLSPDTFVVDIKCSGGTYIRSLARDVAEACGTVGYMSALIRLQSGCFDIKDAFTLDEIREKKELCVLPMDFPLSDVEKYVFDDARFDDINFGRRVPCDSFDGYRKIYCKDTFFGLGKCCNGALDLEYYLKNAF
ncbi:MAG: tRNA pseudouridine(55) synthase TruB [Clostridiales bacterium]|nr:tRNA pseudouridine(55) synthase TruB [Clostridiales bacterium]